MRIKITFISILLLLVLFHTYRCEKVKNSEVIELKSENDDEDVVWIVQLSDLHFSVHYPQRAVEFRNFVAETLAMIKPALVLITGDLTGMEYYFIF
ncbi:Metallophosphoesterase domain-containing protein [Artemisia annua]|uniref:Metallophosphoesterase domain-containing protein n=1 Tax=Artemisia annua TaxID=35608 RepID=A0A2U1NGU4_ARTAN|nr:Metallophosphoesterase domain-containing protein [Artemisia annua]